MNTAISPALSLARHPGRRWPNFYLVGAMKAGTTSIAEALAGHPEVFLCPVKEPNYFSSDLQVSETGADDATQLELVPDATAPPRIHAGEFRNEAAYLSLFSGWREEKIGGECSTSYLYSAVAAEGIARIAPEAKILIVLRNPIERAFSEFVMNCSIGVALPPFSRYLDLEQEQLARGLIPRHHKYVTAGRYARQIRRYLAYFPPAQVEVMLYDDLKTDFAGFMTQVCAFLDIAGMNGSAEVRSNTAKYPRWARMNMVLQKTGVKHLAQGVVPERAKDYLKKYYYGGLPRDLKLGEHERRRLVDAFAGDIAQVSGLIGRDLSSWLA